MITLSLTGIARIDDEFWSLSASERMAIIAHEAGHRHYRHLWVQLFALFCFQSNAVHSAMLHRQELEADQFARAMGYGAALASFLARFPEEASRTHPATRTRIAKLTK